MRKRKKQSYTDEFKRAVVGQVTAGEKPGNVAAQHGISMGSIRNWAQKFGGNGEVPRPKTGNGKAVHKSKGHGNGALHAIRQEIKQHEAAVAKLRKAEATIA